MQIFISEKQVNHFIPGIYENANVLTITNALHTYRFNIDSQIDKVKDAIRDAISSIIYNKKKSTVMFSNNDQQMHIGEYEINKIKYVHIAIFKQDENNKLSSSGLDVNLTIQAAVKFVESF